jgi:hypothetical protein
VHDAYEVLVVVGHRHRLARDMRRGADPASFCPAATLTHTRIDDHFQLLHITWLAYAFRVRAQRAMLADLFFTWQTGPLERHRSLFRATFQIHHLLYTSVRSTHHTHAGLLPDGDAAVRRVAAADAGGARRRGVLRTRRAGPARGRVGGAGRVSSALTEHAYL